MKIIKKEEFSSHPMEDVLGIESGTTIVEQHSIEIEPIKPSSIVDYDEKDDDIEQRLMDIYDLALNQAAVINDQLEIIEGRYKAGLAENSAQMLNVALGAMKERSMLKRHKDTLQISLDRLDLKRTEKNITNNNLVVADRNAIMRMLKDSDS